VQSYLLKSSCCTFQRKKKFIDQDFNQNKVALFEFPSLLLLQNKTLIDEKVSSALAKLLRQLDKKDQFVFSEIQFACLLFIEKFKVIQLGLV